MNILETAQFRKSISKIDKTIRKKIQKQFALFLKNFFHPSLCTEKLEPKNKNIWSFRVDKNFRVIFTFVDEATILLLDIGNHDIYRHGL